MVSQDRRHLFVTPCHMYTLKSLALLLIIFYSLGNLSHILERPACLLFIFQIIKLMEELDQDYIHLQVEYPEDHRILHPGGCRTQAPDETALGLQADALKTDIKSDDYLVIHNLYMAPTVYVYDYLIRSSQNFCLSFFAFTRIYSIYPSFGRTRLSNPGS